MWERIEGDWARFRAGARHQWAKLTDEHLDEVDGRRDRLSRRICDVYGVSDEEADKQIAAWETELREQERARGPALDGPALEVPRPGVVRDAEGQTRFLDNPGQEANREDRMGGRGLPTNQAGGRDRGGADPASGTGFQDPAAVEPTHGADAGARVPGDRASARRPADGGRSGSA